MLDVAAIIVSVAAVLIAIGTAIYERRDRQAQLAVLRGQLAAQTQASMYAEFLGMRWEPAEYDFRVGNGGPAVARSIRLWMRAGNTSAGAVEFEPMLPGDHRTVTIHVGRPLAYIVGVQTNAELVCSWADDSGPREEVLIPDLPSGTG
jgi:hypothetical protein